MTTAHTGSKPMATNLDVFDLDDDSDHRYVAQLLPELYPRERQPVLANWPEEDREVFEPNWRPT
jgi:hypothetical protein